MFALIVVESYFGCTFAIAGQIAVGLRRAGAQVHVVAAVEASGTPVCDLLLVGAPTHNAGLPSPASRAQATARGGTAPAFGVAEWLDRLDATRLPGKRVAAFDTAVPGLFSGSAAKRIEQRLKRVGVGVEARESFTVINNTLAPGEADRANGWGARLANSPSPR